MKKLKIFESNNNSRNDKYFTTIPDNFEGDIRFSCFEGSYPYIEPVALKNTTLEKAKEEATKKLQERMNYRKTDEKLWARFEINSDGNNGDGTWKADSSKDLVLNP